MPAVVTLVLASAIGVQVASAAPSALPGVQRGAAQAAANQREGWTSWALLDRQTRTLAFSATGMEPNNTESMIKMWIAADYLLGAQADKRALGDIEKGRIESMIRVSDDSDAQVLYKARGGDAVIERAIGTCRLKATTIRSGRWSLTQMPASDAVRMADCVASPMSGLNAENRDYLLGLMRTVEASNAFGITPLLTEAPAVKNGWTEHSGTGLWNLNCLALFGEGDRYAVAVETRYDRSLGQRYGEQTCQLVAAPLIPDRYEAAAVMPG